MSNFALKFLKFQFGLKARTSLYERLASYVEEDYPVFDSLSRFEQRYRKNRDFRANVIRHWLDEMRKGKSFSQAIEGWVPSSEITLITAGEKGDGLEVGLREAIRFTSAISKIRGAIIGNAAYPIVLLLMMVGILSLFALKISPIYEGILPVRFWSSDGKILHSISNFLVKQWYFPVSVIGTIVAFIIMSIDKLKGPFRLILDKIPPYSIYKRYYACAFLISLSALLKAAMPLDDALKALRKTANPWLSDYLNKMISNLRRGGRNYGEALDVGLLDNETAGDVIDYSSLGGVFEESVYRIGEKGLEHQINLITAQMNVFKIFMLILVAVTIGWVYFTSASISRDVADRAKSFQKK